MKRYLLLALTTLVLSTQVEGQVKIGDNSNSINPNSLLELESGTKGLLAPRVTLTDLLSPAPLTAPVPEGMLVYNIGTSPVSGFYYWDGTKWKIIGQSVQGRNNYVLVKDVSDFPQATNGIITLASNTVYEINGTISTEYSINLNNAWISGLDAVNDKIIFSGSSGALITGTKGGNIKSVTLSAPNTGSKVFELDAGGASDNLIMEYSYIKNSDNVGSISGFGGNIYFQTVIYFSNLNGITFSNDTNVMLVNTFWGKDNSNTFERFVGNFSSILKTGGAMNALASNSATCFSISEITNVHAGEMKNCVFMGDGVYKSGNFSSRWEVECNGIATEKDDVSMGNIYMTAANITDVPLVNTAVKIAGTTSTASTFRVTSPCSNRLTYTGKKKRSFQVLCSLTMTCAGSNKNFTYYIAKNGVILNESRQLLRMPPGVDRGTLTISCTVELAPNDYVELWGTNNTDNTQFVVETMNMSIK